VPNIALGEVAQNHCQLNGTQHLGWQMTLDDVYGSDNDRFPLEQEARAWDAEDSGLVWDESEILAVASDLGVVLQPA